MEDNSSVQSAERLLDLRTRQIAETRERQSGKSDCRNKSLDFTHLDSAEVMLEVKQRLTEDEMVNESCRFLILALLGFEDRIQLGSGENRRRSLRMETVP